VVAKEFGDMIFPSQQANAQALSERIKPELVAARLLELVES